MLSWICILLSSFTFIYLATGKIIIITAPSGSGKTTLVKQLMQHCPQLSFSISACTRSPRSGEVNARDYYFFDEAHFKQLIAGDAFIEWEMVYPGKYYGTLKSELGRAWGNNQTPLVDIDVHGAIAIREKYPQNSMSIFIMAPSLDTIQERLHKRGTETEKSLNERITKAAYELTFADRFDHIVVNDNLEIATKELISLVENWIDK